MEQLSQSEIEFITQCLKEGKPLPDSYRYIIPFETKKEYELTYADKEREEDILADTFAVPLQPVKTFGSNGDGWTNKLIFGGNLQVLRTLTQMKQEGNLKNADGMPGVRMVYIDPPFATKQEFRGSQDQKAYQDKVIGAEFLEFLRKRLILLRELLADNGTIYVHLDWKKGHYLKTLMDEIFGEQHFRNEIIVRRTQKNFVERDRIKAMNIAYDSILFYAKHHDAKIKPPFREEKRPEVWHAFDAPNWAGTRPNLWYELFGYFPPTGSCWRWTKERAEKAIREGKLRANPRSGRPEYLVPAREKVLCTNLWDDITAYSFKYDYPTEKTRNYLGEL